MSNKPPMSSLAGAAEVFRLAEAGTYEIAIGLLRSVESEIGRVRTEAATHRAMLGELHQRLAILVRRKHVEEADERRRRSVDAFRKAARLVLPSDMFEAVDAEARRLTSIEIH
jgi:hypothetical protein